MKRTTTSISTQPLNKAVFLDRDGTINSDEGHYYIYKPEDFVFNPGVIEGLKRLQKAGYIYPGRYVQSTRKDVCRIGKAWSDPD